jgi:prefoldin subunit 5
MQVNKKINDLDNDFNRLIESLKNQFQSVNDLINQVDESKVNISDIKQIVLECLNNNNQEIGMFPKTARTPNVKLSSPWDNNNLLEGYKLKSINDGGQIITQHISAMPSLIPDGMNNNFNQNNFQTKSMKQELIILKNEINSDFERINTKILNELQNQANDIKQLYQEIHTMTLTNKAQNNNPILPMTSSYESNLNSNSFLNSNIIEINNELAKHTNFIMQLDQELTKKANIDQLNYALEAQAKINDALCNANKIARWSWSDDSSVNENGFIIWSIQNINTALDVFSWETNNENIFVNLKGIYKISAGVILTYTKNYNKDKEEDVFYIIVNGENVMSGKRIDEGIVFVEGYIPLPDEAKIQIKMNINRNGRNELDGEIYNTEAFLEIKKLI